MMQAESGNNGSQRPHVIRWKYKQIRVQLMKFSALVGYSHWYVTAWDTTRLGLYNFCLCMAQLWSLAPPPQHLHWKYVAHLDKNTTISKAVSFSTMLGHYIACACNSKAITFTISNFKDAHNTLVEISAGDQDSTMKAMSRRSCHENHISTSNKHSGWRSVPAWTSQQKHRLAA